jgi:RNA polymerase sigma-70 factor (sigma-E family)
MKPRATATVQGPGACNGVSDLNVVEREWQTVAGRNRQPQSSDPNVAAAFDAYVRDHQLGLVRFATLLSGSRTDAEDLVQEVLVRLYPRWPDLLAQQGSLHGYVRKAITNQHISGLRRWSVRNIGLADRDVLEAVVQPGPAEVDADLWDELTRLPVNQRAAIVLRFYEGLTDAEIAETMSCRQGTVRSHVSRGLARLRTSLAEAAHSGSGHSGSGPSEVGKC